ncbi:MAG TPA: hypothetical protein PKI20_01260 [Verrucomicrobiota bacterium]|nr:hypothetical protein [Verrucomicrobiota bacterium]
MSTAEIPNQILNEAYQAIAERREVNPAALDRCTVDEAELMAALAYVLGLPLVEPADLTESRLADCSQLAAELETAALMEYRFVPMARHGEILSVISSNPWDPIATEVLLGYFQQCTQVKFALASPQCLQELLDHLRQAEARTQASAGAGYTPRPMPVNPTSSRSRTTAPTAVSPTRSGEGADVAAVVMPPGAKPPLAAKVPAVLDANPGASANADRGAPTTADDGAPLLTLGDVTHLINVLATEIHRLVQQKRGRPSL